MDATLGELPWKTGTVAMKRNGLLQLQWLQLQPEVISGSALLQPSLLKRSDVSQGVWEARDLEALLCFKCESNMRKDIQRNALKDAHS